MATHVYYQGEYVYRGVIFPGYIRRNLARAFEEQFECRDDDVFIVSYPRSGTTWTTEMVSLVMNGGDTEYNMSDIQHTRVPQIEVNYKPNIIFNMILRVLIIMRMMLPTFLHQYMSLIPKIKDFRSFNDAFEWSKSIPSPRLMRTHLQYNLFAKEPIKRKCKFIYVARNPKDMLVSYYYFYKMCRVHGCYDGSWAAFFRKFINKQLCYGDWFDHVIGWWKYAQKNTDTVLFLKYEDIKKNPRSTIMQISKFLNKELHDRLVDEIIHHCCFHRMQNNAGVNFGRESYVMNTKRGKFIRKGIIGDWRNHFTLAQNEEFNKLYEYKMKDTGLSFQWDGEN